MREWQLIQTAPKDGTVVRLKRLYEGRVIAEGEGLFGVRDERAPGRQPLPPDPLGRSWPEGFEAERLQISALPQWIQADKMYLFPTPTHWMPLS